MAKICYRCEWVRCGKASCRSCPHGPYWYAYWWCRETKKTRKRYCGKGDPRTVGAEPEARAEGPAPHPHDAIFDDGTASRRLALEIMGLRDPLTPRQITLRLRELSLLHHPDRGGNARVMSRINAAAAYLRR